MPFTMRGTHTRKRSRPTSFKGKRTFKKRRVTRARKTNNLTSQSGKGGGLSYRAKRVGRSAYRRLLWNASILKTKYRTVQATNTSVATNANSVTQTTFVRSSINFGVAPFWTILGGSITPDSASTLPVFTGNIILRGGIIGCRISNTIDTSVASQGAISGTMMLIQTTKAFNPSAIPATIPLGWDPTYITDFSTVVGRIVYKKTFLLRDTDVAQVEWRLKVRSIDETDYSLFLNQLVWVLTLNTTDNIAHGVTVNTYYNMSFTGDGV